MWWQRMNDRMRDAGVSQAELARRTGLNVKSIQKYTRGEVRHPHEGVTERIAHALDVTNAWLWGQNHVTGDANVVGMGGKSSLSSVREGEPLLDVPVYQTGPTGTWGVMSLRMLPIDTAERRAGITSAPGVYAIYMQDDCVAPRYRQGEIVYIHPDRPARTGEYVMVTLADGTVMVRRLIASGPEGVTLEQHTPPVVQVVPLARITSMAHVLTHNELAGI